MPRWVLLSTLGCLYLVAAGCRSHEPAKTSAPPSSSPPSAASPRRIAVIPKGNTHEYWKAVHAGANKAGRELGVEVVWKGPVREDDRDEQIKVVENFVASHVDAIVLAPLDDRALVPPAREASQEGIPVVIMDSNLQWDGRVSFVATDNYQGGVVAARRMGQVLGGQGKLIVLRYQEGSSSTAERERGFIETVQHEFPGLSLLSSNQYGGATTETAYKTSEDLLVEWKQLDGVFCPNESTTFGMLRALQDAKRAGQVKFVGFDSSPKLIAALGKGEIDALVVQHPFRIGELAVHAAVDKLNHKPVQARIDTGVELVTHDNMGEPAMQAVLAPKLAEWLQ